MSNTLHLSRRRVSLTVRFSALLILAVVIPLLITVLSSVLILSPALTNQAVTEMKTDAMKRSDTIDAYLEARLQELTYVSQFRAIREYLSRSDNNNFYYDLARKELIVSHSLDAGYSNWTLFKPQVNAQNHEVETPVLSYPQSSRSSDPDATIPQTIQDLLGENQNKSIISNVYYNSTLRQAYVDLYTAVKDDKGVTLGIERASLLLSSMWDVVNNEYNAGTRDYAMIIDNHNVCIAYTSTDTTQTTLPDELFKAIAPLPTAFSQQVNNEHLYNSITTPTSVMRDDTLTALTQDTNAAAYTQFTPTGQNEKYEVVKSTGALLPWSYVVFRPMSTITSAANQQILYLFIISCVVTFLAAVIGLVVGRSITRPIQHSVNTLRGNSDALKGLATAEEATAMEQKWIIDSSQVGLQSVQYYANATGSAARHLNSVGENLLLNWGRMDSAQAKQGLDDILTAARYIEKAADHQKNSCDGLNDAIQVTAQVTDQLVTGATSATDAANQLDKVVAELREVVGK
jgi:hypothetical protein